MLLLVAVLLVSTAFSATISLDEVDGSSYERASDVESNRMDPKVLASLLG